jgi:hypothetical protein
MIQIALVAHGVRTVFQAVSNLPPLSSMQATPSFVHVREVLAGRCRIRRRGALHVLPGWVCFEKTDARTSGIIG